MPELVVGCESICNWLDDVCKRRSCWRWRTAWWKDLIPYQASVIDSVKELK
jgi:hypothetical protein